MERSEIREGNGGGHPDNTNFGVRAD